MKKEYFVKVICFLLIGALLFVGAQSILRFKTEDARENYSRNIAFEAEPAGSIDAVFLGTSEIYVGVCPMTIFDETGITSYNMAMTHTSAVITYYQLMYVLKHQTPKIVLCDFSALYKDGLPSSGQEALFWRFLEGTPDLKLKTELIRTIPVVDPEEKLLDWCFPLFRFHSSWNELKEDNFKSNHSMDPGYDVNGKGCELRYQPYDGGHMVLRRELWETDETSDELFSDVSVEYYRRIIEACQERNITIVALIPPKMSETYLKTSRWPYYEAYFDSMGVDVMDYNNFEQTDRMGIVIDDDYFNPEHLNAIGAQKFSHVIAEDLQARYDLPDHREDALGAAWKDCSDAFWKAQEGK